MSGVASHPQRDMRYVAEETRTGSGQKLFVRRWSPDGEAAAWLVMTHGLGEHTARHQFSAEYFAGRGLGVVAYDLRGHGRSAGRRGHIWRYGSVLEDLEHIRTSLIPGDCPVFSFGHSFGGQITLNYALSGRTGFDGYVVTAPWLGLAIKPPLPKLVAGKIARWLCPILSFPLGLKRDQLATDPQLELSEEEEALMHRRVTAWTFGVISDAAVSLVGSAGRFHAPLLLVHGSDDPVTDPRMSERFLSEIPSSDKELQLWPGGRHELHNEECREEVLCGIADWILARR